MASSGPKAIQTAAKNTDGLISISKPDKTKEIIALFDKAAREEGKELKNLQKIGKPKISYSEDYDKAWKSSEFWIGGEIKDVLIQR